MYNDVTSFNYSLATDHCKEKNSSTNGKSIFVAIISAPSYFKKRQLIRTTWARHFATQSHLVHLAGFAFIVGHSSNNSVEDGLEKESQQYGDILQVGMMDGYYNITLKVAGLLNWIHKNCPSVDYVLKADDDVYVNVRNLSPMLMALPSVTYGMFGTEMSPLFSLEPQRNPGLKNDINSSSIIIKGDAFQLISGQ